MSQDVHIITNQNDNHRASYSLLLLEGSQKSFNREMLGSDCFFFFWKVFVALKPARFHAATDVKLSV